MSSIDRAYGECGETPKLGLLLVREQEYTD
jgi:hypothetical protein